MSWGPLAAGAAPLTDFSPTASTGVAAAARMARGHGGADQFDAPHLLPDASGLMQRWTGRARFVVLATGFGLGHAFLATWQAWRDDPKRSARLVYLAISAQPPTADQLRLAHSGAAPHQPDAGLVAELADHWPPRTPDLHLLDLDGGRVRLMLAFGTPDQVLPELVAQADAFVLCGGDDDEAAAFWDRYRTRQLARLAAPEAWLASASSADSLRTALRSAGFAPQAGPGGQGTVARFAPRFQPPAPPGRRSQPQARRVAVVGAGLAGAGVARALAAQGLEVAVFERGAGPAAASSGNPGGLFHGIVHGHDGPHARWLRAAALHCASVLRPWLGQASPAAQGAVQGLVRGERQLDAAAMQAVVDRLALPADYVQVLPQGWPDGGPAWLYPGGGWVSPAALCRHWLAAPGITLHCNATVARLATDGALWRLHDQDGHCLTEVDAVLLCNGADARRLVGAPGGAAPGLVWPLRQVRGQVTLVPASLTEASAPTATHRPGPRPLADTGYALQLPDGRWLCGATSQPGDDEPALRASDHRLNLATLQRLTGLGHGLDTAMLDGRVGWRVQSDDRLPLLGPVPQGPCTADGTPHGPSDAGAEAGVTPRRRADQPRLVPRVPGLYVFTALGSRGISQAGLGGELLAAWLTGAPVPAPASLLDALDPARFIARATRREMGA